MKAKKSDESQSSQDLDAAYDSDAETPTASAGGAGIKKRKGPELALPTEDSCSVTVGTEIERHKIMLSSVQLTAFKIQLQKSKKADAIRSLELDQVLRNEAQETACLCMVSKGGDPFMEVTFDDNNNPGQIEFISKPRLKDGIHTGGVKKMDDFCELQNVKDIGFVTSNFPEAIQLLKSSENNSTKIGGFEFAFPAHAAEMFRQTKLDETKATAIHLTHSISVSNDEQYLGALKEFLKLQRQRKKVDFSEDEQGLNILRSEFIEQTYHALLDQTFPPRVEYKGWNTSLRNNNNPVLKIPRDHFYPNDKPKNLYMQQSLSNEVLPPVSNLVEHTVEQIKIYEELYKTLCKMETTTQETSSSIAAAGSGDKVISPDPAIATSEADIDRLLTQEAASLGKAKLKLNKTIEGLKSEVVKASTGQYPEAELLPTQYLKIVREIKGGDTKYKDISIFDSFEEKFQLLPLCEHRVMEGAPVLGTFAEIIQGLEQTPPIEDKLITEKCNSLVGHFQPLKEADRIFRHMTQRVQHHEMGAVEEGSDTKKRREDTSSEQHHNVTMEGMEKFASSQVAVSAPRIIVATPAPVNLPLGNTRSSGVGTAP